MGRPSNSEARRAQIVGALQTLMATRGYEGASVVAIAEAAGLAPGLVHYHFKSKQEILLALVDELGTRLARRAWEATEGAVDARGRLLAWLDAHVALGSGADPAAVACWVAIGAESLRQPEVHAVYAAALTQERAELERLLTDAAAPARLTAQRRRQFASGLLAAVQGAYLVGTAAPDAVVSGFARPALHAMVDGMLSQAPQ